jgi:hypothetical protein
MHKYFLAFLIFILNTTAYCQTLHELENRHGFKDIRLVSHIDSLKGTKLKKEIKEKDEFPAKLYSLEHPDYSRIGEVKIKSIELKTYNDLIFEISVTVDKDPRLMKALESLYGKADFDAKNETYFWRAENLILKFRSAGKNHLELLYTSFIVNKMMKDDKKKKVDEIANDF